MYKVDMHCKVIGRRVFKRLEQRGIYGYLYAPHHSMFSDRSIRRIKNDIKEYEGEFNVFLGKEIEAKLGHTKVHVVGIGIQENMLDNEPLEYILENIQEQGGASVIAHPFAPFFGRVDYGKYKPLIDGIEIQNAQCTRGLNNKARKIAEEYDIQGIGSSYAHFARRAGAGWTIFKDEIEDTDELIQAIKKREIDGVGRVHGISGFIEDMTDYFCQSFHGATYFATSFHRNREIENYLNKDK